MPLVFWTLGWVGLVSLSGLIGDIWRWVNPWTGLYQLIGPLRPLVTLPKALGVWPAILLLIGFAAFILADIAPDDPARLAHLVSFYWLLTMTGLILCGPAWLRQVELGSVIFSTYSSLAAARLRPNGGIGFPGWRLLERAPMPAGGIFALTLLAVGSFDGLNETFWWLAKIGINPLAFPGRSAVVWPTLLGLIGAIIALIIVFAATVWLGLLLSPGEATFADVFGRLALSVLPIALAYHIAHYLTAFLVNSQYALAALSDPLASGCRPPRHSALLCHHGLFQSHRQRARHLAHPGGRRGGRPRLVRAARPSHGAGSFLRRQARGAGDTAALPVHDRLHHARPLAARHAEGGLTVAIPAALRDPFDRNIWTNRRCAKRILPE